MAVAMTPDGTGQPGEAGGRVLALDGVSVRLAGRQILDDVSFTVRPGPGREPARHPVPVAAAAPAG
jgi:ABC-type molybdenum transport system ATPase subunit/photorepair protein PhrA